MHDKSVVVNWQDLKIAKRFLLVVSVNELLEKQWSMKKRHVMKWKQ